MNGQTTLAAAPAGSDRAAQAPAWSVILPFYNEREHLPLALASLSAQTIPFRLILVDNGSTDTGAAYARRRICEGFNDAVMITETRPGKVAALAAGLRLVDTPYVATCDADTWYPPEYLAEAQALMERGGPTTHAAGAYFVEDPRSRTSRLMGALHWLTAARLMPRQTHTGGAGQIFRTESLKRAGGFDPARWNYVLEDHEIFQRLLRLGRVRYGKDLWCAPSNRPRQRGVCASWTLPERLLYHVTPHWLKDWYFYGFLGPRLAARGLLSHRLRVIEPEATLVAA